MSLDHGKIIGMRAGHIRFLKSLGPVLLVFASAVSWNFGVTKGGHALPYDAFRDTAWSQNMLEGEIWADPSILGASWWYAPAGPALMAAIAGVSGQETVNVHAQSSLWLNSMILTLFFILVRRTTTLPTAAVALPFLVFGSLWWMTHIAAAMPSIQGVVPALLSLLMWNWCVEGLMGDDRPLRTIIFHGIATGLGLAVTAWWHPVCALVVAGAVGFHVLMMGLSGNVRWRRLWTILGTTTTTAILFSAPLLLHLLMMPHRNPVPFGYIAPEMSNPVYAIGAGTPAVGLLALVGLVLVMRGRPHLGWLPGMLAIALIGQAPAYLSWWRRLGLPMLVPHEFQWQGQLAVAALAAIGLVGAVGFTSRYFREFSGRRFILPVIGIILLVGSLAPAVPYLQFAGAYLANVDEIMGIRQEVVDWIKDSTDVDDVFACPAPEAYLLVGGLTGRKCAALPAGHTNPSVDAFGRLSRLSTLQTTSDEQIFLRAAQDLGIDYVLVTLNSEEAVGLYRRLKQWPGSRRVFSTRLGKSLIFEVLGTSFRQIEDGGVLADSP